MRGRFIVFEGLDGSGKTTALERLAAHLTDPLITREPSDGPVGKLIRQALTHQISFEPETFAPLFGADRYEHIMKEVLPALEAGRDVLCDRYYFSNLVYQGDVVSREMILNFNALSIHKIKPDQVFYINTPPEECLRRIHAGRDMVELFEKKEKLESVSRLYEEVFEFLKGKENICVIDGMQTPEEIEAEILDKMGISC